MRMQTSSGSTGPRCSARSSREGWIGSTRTSLSCLGAGRPGPQRHVCVRCARDFVFMGWGCMRALDPHTHTRAHTRAHAHTNAHTRTPRARACTRTHPHSHPPLPPLPHPPTHSLTHSPTHPPTHTQLEEGTNIFADVSGSVKSRKKEMQGKKAKITACEPAEGESGLKEGDLLLFPHRLRFVCLCVRACSSPCLQSH